MLESSENLKNLNNVTGDEIVHLGGGWIHYSVSQSTFYFLNIQQYFVTSKKRLKIVDYLVTDGSIILSSIADCTNHDP